MKERSFIEDLIKNSIEKPEFRILQNHIADELTELVHSKENLNIANIIFANHSYEILKIELSRVGAVKTGDRADSMFSLDNPKLDWIKLSESMGVPCYEPNTVEEFKKIFSACVKEAGPSTILVQI